MTRRQTKERTQSAPTSLTRAAFALRDVKALNEGAGTFSGYVAVFNNTDGNGDVIERGAFKKTLAEAREVKSRTGSQFIFPILWQHDEHDPIGGFTDAHEDDYGLAVQGELDIDVENGARAYSALMKGYMRGMSIGYYPVKAHYGPDRARHLTEIRLFEGSLTTFPANELALVREVKSASGKTDWPLAPRDTAWSNSEAHNAIVAKATKDDGSLDTALLKSVHFWYDPDNADQIGGYKLLFCDVIGGDVTAVRNGIIACTGAHGVQAIKGVSDADMTAIKGRIATYYRRMAKEYDDESIVVPWADDGGGAKEAQERSARARKQAGGLQALIACAVALDNCSDMAEGFVETLAGACGLSVEDGDAIGRPDGPVAALLGALPDLEGAIKAVLTAWQDFDQQTDALLAALSIPDDDGSPVATAGPLYMESLRSAVASGSESKESRQLSAANRSRLSAVADGLQAHAEEVKAILRENDRNKVDENAQDVDVDQIIAAGRRPGDSSGKSATLFERVFGLESAGRKPVPTTSPPARPEPDPTDRTTQTGADGATLEDVYGTLLTQSLDLHALDA